MQSTNLENSAPLSAFSSPPVAPMETTNLLSSSACRPSVMAAAAQMKASKVRLFRNGDPFFKGIMLAITVERFRTFDSLLAELNQTTLCDPSVLRKGVRYIFTLNGEQVRSLDQLRDGCAYVCASTPVFRPMDYSRMRRPMNWKINFRNGDEGKTGIAKSSGDFNDIDRNYIEPKMIYTIRSGPRPRNMARMVLNKRTARSFDQVMTDLAESVNMETGTIRQLYTVTGKQVLSLRDFFQDDSIFVAFGSEKFSLSEMRLSDIESKFVNGSSPRNTRSATVKTTPQIRRAMSHSPDGRLQNTLGVNSRMSNMGGGTGEHLRPSSSISSAAPASTNNRRERRGGHLQPSSNSSVAPASTDNMGEGTDIDPVIPQFFLCKYQVTNIGRCGYVSLHFGIDIKTHNSVAFKVYNKTEMSKEKQFLARSELFLLRRMKHQNIIHLLDELETPTALFMVLGVSQGRNLLDSIASCDDYSEVDASHLLFQLCHAINFLHSMNIVHRSIRPESILVSLEPKGRKHLKLSDFSMATEISAPLDTPCGAIGYMAPEMLLEKRYSTKVDVWAAGVVGYIMLCGYLPYTGSTKEQLLTGIKSGPLDFPCPAWDSISDSAKDLIAFMLEEDVNIRSTATDVLDHPWLSVNEQKIVNLQPTVKSNIRKLAGGMDKCKRMLGAVIGMAVLEGNDGQVNFEVHDDPDSNDVPPHSAAVPTSSSPFIDPATKSPPANPAAVNYSRRQQSSHL